MQLLIEQFQAIYSEYNETQLKNSRLLLERQKEVHDAIPELKELDDTIASYSVASARAAFDGGKVDIEHLKKRISDISQKKNFFFHKTDIRQIICSQSITVRTAWILAISGMKNVTALRKKSWNTCMSSLI